MSVRAESMRDRAMTDHREPAGMILRKLAIVFLVGLIGGVGFSFVGLANRTIEASAFEWVAWAGLGLLSGFTSRRALRGRSLTLRGLASLSSVIVGMLFVGWISGGEAGLVIPHAARAVADWPGILQVTLAGLSAGLALMAWEGGRLRNPPVAAQSSAVPDDVPEQVIRRPAPTAAPSPPISLPRLRAGAIPEFPERISSRLRRLAQRAQFLKDFPGIWVKEHLPGWEKTATLLRGRRAFERGRVRLVGAEEHRCPYCLDAVERRDPRGVVICKVCHTRHHADCWAVAGMCQVPHDHR
jgi:hypothetical protein